MFGERKKERKMMSTWSFDPNLWWTSCSTLDRLARVQVHLLLCDPNSAEMELSSLDKVGPDFIALHFSHRISGCVHLWWHYCHVFWAFGSFWQIVNILDSQFLFWCLPHAGERSAFFWVRRFEKSSFLNQVFVSIDLTNNNNILYSSQREIKAVVRSHNEEHISIILSHETHAHTHS